MKKLIVCSLTLALLSGCFWNGGGQPATQPSPSTAPIASAQPDGAAQTASIADGAYFAAEEGYSDGWKNFIAFTAEDGRIASAVWDCLPESGSQLKSVLAAEGKYVMKSAGAQREWDEQSQLFTDALISSQGLPTREFDSAGKTDAIAGVTISVKEVSALYEQALRQGALPHGDFQDGLFYAEAKQFDRDGYRESVALYVSGGRIVWVNWNAAKQDSDKTKKSMGDEYGLKAASGIGAEWYQQAAAFEDYVIDSQGVSNLNTDAAGKTDAITGCTISVSGARTLTEQILTQAQTAG